MTIENTSVALLLTFLSQLNKKYKKEVRVCGIKAAFLNGSHGGELYGN